MSLDTLSVDLTHHHYSHVIAAARAPINLDDRQVNAVAARIELDLRVGSIFTRFQTKELQKLCPQLLEGKMISYGEWHFRPFYPPQASDARLGPCQFPTLGFVVDRYFKVKNFIPERFWGIKVNYTRDNINVNFLWDRNRLFDRASVIILFERCLKARKAKVTKLLKKPTSRWKPLPLTTVELQKLGSMFLRMDSQTVMKVAEDLYTKGFISYPRTETDQFDKGIDLKKLIEKQLPDQRWGAYAQGLLDGAFSEPRKGRNNDQAHPPIHPVSWVDLNKLASDESRRVYEFIARRFLGCCSEDAKGESSTVEILYGIEGFHTTGLIVLQRNYLDVYTYDRWESSQPLPQFRLNEDFEPTEANITDGQTSPPGYLTEPELIGLMDANGIGTDATMAEHIAKVKEREYVLARPRSGVAPQAARGGGRGGRGGRGSANATMNGRSTGGGGNGVMEFIPTTLGTALISGYDAMGFSTSLGKPHLRKEMELKMKDICAGTKMKREVIEETLEGYREVWVTTKREVEVLKNAVRRYVLGEGGV
jgi:DNA topoisomerase-3